ncbi:hypothetical protein [Nocardia terpenica]|uniref:Uncharacterized protein n=1 Tax=Nocardia terpenica TaxID=455432 RepID=A0A164K6G3_9NOCA|nr:hypothetical protein [Nocardia terpenica]KZM71084.1 hypothetical protein AWN90_41980 [Nocardia terpenica]NQE89590.1 hypothetical protein [Nocardia terpenica]
MYWRYDLMVCTNPDVTPGAHDGYCTFAFRRSECDYAYVKAFELACAETHAVVMCSTGSRMAVHRSFEHVTGGRLCEWCGKGRGPLLNLSFGHRFLCDSCRADGLRDEREFAKQHGITQSSIYFRPVFMPGEDK